MVTPNEAHEMLLKWIEVVTDINYLDYDMGMIFNPYYDEFGRNINYVGRSVKDDYDNRMELLERERTDLEERMGPWLIGIARDVLQSKPNIEGMREDGVYPEWIAQASIKWSYLKHHDALDRIKLGYAEYYAENFRYAMMDGSDPDEHPPLVPGPALPKPEPIIIPKPMLSDDWINDDIPF